MDPSFWRARWQEGRIGFHQGRPNAQLVKHVDRLGRPGRIFVPLCGKAADMAFLASRGHRVLGVELVESALRDFFREHDLEPEVATSDRFTTLRSGGLTLLAGDFFALEPGDLEGVTAAYDRASIVALPPETRARYVERLRVLLPKGAPILTVTFEYDASRFEGPPFSVDGTELCRLYGADATIDLLDTGPIPPGGALAQAAVGAVESCWLVTP
jgi:thiopurine S-methyltransferase